MKRRRVDKIVHHRRVVLNFWILDFLVFFSLGHVLEGSQFKHKINEVAIPTSLRTRHLDFVKQLMEKSEKCFSHPLENIVFRFECYFPIIC